MVSDVAHIFGGGMCYFYSCFYFLVTHLVQECTQHTDRMPMGRCYHPSWSLLVQNLHSAGITTWS